MFIINLRRTAVINSMQCIAIRQRECRVQALTEQNHPDCACLVTLAEYSTEVKAKEEFNKLIEAMKLGKKYYEMGEE